MSMSELTESSAHIFSCADAPVPDGTTIMCETARGLQSLRKSYFCMFSSLLDVGFEGVVHLPPRFEMKIGGRETIDERILKANLCRFPYRSVFGQPHLSETGRAQ